MSSVAWELDVWGRIRRTVESDKAAAVASESDLANALLSAQAMLVQSYMQLRATDTDLDLYERSVVAYQRAMLDGLPPQWDALAYSAAIAIVLFVLGFGYFDRAKDDFESAL